MNEPRHRETLIHLTHEESNFYFSFCVTQRERQSERERERGTFRNGQQTQRKICSDWLATGPIRGFHCNSIHEKSAWRESEQEEARSVGCVCECVCACGCMCVCVCVGDWVVVPLCLARQTESSLPYFITIVKWTKESCIVFLWKVVNV